MTHLREVCRLPVAGDKLVVRGKYGFVGSLHAKAPHALSVLDLSAPAQPRVIAELPFRYQMQALALVGEVLYVSEYRRAVHLVRIDDPAKPTTADAVLMFRQEIYELAHAGSRWLACARNWDGVSVFDVSDPLHPRQTDQRTLGSSFVESIQAVGDRVFAAAHKDGLVELRIDDTGKLVEVARYFGGEDGFSAQRVHIVGDRLWVFGNGKLDPATAEADEEEDADSEGADEDEAYEEPEDDPDCVVLSLADLSQRMWVGVTSTQPHTMTALPDGGCIAFDSYKCFHFRAGAKPVQLFSRQETRPDRDNRPGEPRRYFEVEGDGRDSERPDFSTSICDDAAAWARLDNYLLIKQPQDVVVYEIAPDSPLAKMAGGDVLTSRR